MPETLYASRGDLSLAYQVFGDGPVELVFAGPFVSHVELFWAMPEFKSFFEQLGTFCRIVIFDKAGVGLSDPVSRVRSVDDRVAEILHGTVAFSAFEWDDLDRDPAEGLARNVRDFREEYLPSTEQVAKFQEIARGVRSGWGSGGDGAGDDGSRVPDGRPTDPAGDLGADPGQPCPR